MYGCENNNKEIVEYLIKEKADLNIKDNNNETILI